MILNIMIQFQLKAHFIFKQNLGEVHRDISFDLENIKVAGEVGEKLWGIFLKIGYYLQS